MTDQRDRDDAIHAVDAWFASRRFHIVVRHDAGLWAADLYNRAGDLVAESYGRANTPDGAAERARERWSVEQDGGSPRDI
jgi:hypothetical protein